jgi:hypothetical protein
MSAGVVDFLWVHRRNAPGKVYNMRNREKGGKTAKLIILETVGFIDI